MLDRELTGTQQFFGNEKYLVFGNELHKRWLEPKEKIKKLDAEEEKLLKAMLKRLNSDKELMAYYRQAKKEIVTVKPVFGAYVKVTLDLKNNKKRSGKDLKSTSATTLDGFIKSAHDYNYFKQAAIYMEAEELDEFEFIGISKKGDNEIFKLNVKDFPIQMEAGRDKAKGLIQIHTSIKQYLDANYSLKSAA